MEPKTMCSSAAQAVAEAVAGSLAMSESSHSLDPAPCESSLPPVATVAASAFQDPLQTLSSESQPGDSLTETGHGTILEYWQTIASTVLLPSSPGGPDSEMRLSPSQPDTVMSMDMESLNDGHSWDGANANLQAKQEYSPGQYMDDVDIPDDTKTIRPLVLSTGATSLDGTMASLPQDNKEPDEPCCTKEFATSPSVSLAELAHLVRLQNYQEQRSHVATIRHYRSLVSAALSARLVHCGALAYRTLADYFRSDCFCPDCRPLFADLYNAIHDVKDSCEAYRRYAVLEPEFGSRHVQGLQKTPKSFSHTTSTFINDLSAATKDDLLDLLSEIRTNPEFLASRIASLDQQELASLIGFRQSTHGEESIMASQGKTGKPISKQRPKCVKAQASKSVEKFLSFQRHDPLSALIQTTFADPIGSGTVEDLRRTEVWASTCARLIHEGRAGSEKFITSVLDHWALNQAWPAKSRLEQFLMEVLQDGQFLIDRTEDARFLHPRENTVLGRSISTFSAKEDPAVESFFNNSIKHLFEIIDSACGPDGIPREALHLGAAILRKLDPSKKSWASASKLIAVRWFLSSYVLGVIQFPESHGILIGHHISDLARRTLLAELATRTQQLILSVDYSWKSSTPFSEGMFSHINNIRSHFERMATQSSPNFEDVASRDLASDDDILSYVLLCPSDLITIVKALFPERRQPTSIFENTMEVSSINSATSSISGASAPFQMTNDGSSILSLGASSATSDTVSGEGIFDCSSPENRSSWSEDDCLSEASKAQSTEQLGKRLRLACSDMANVIGQRTCAGTCHPCAEVWAILYISPDGKVQERDLHVKTESCDRNSGDGNYQSKYGNVRPQPSGRSTQTSNYGYLEKAIMRLLQEFELPPHISSGNKAVKFGNRTYSLRRSTRSSFQVRTDAAQQDITDRNLLPLSGQATSCLLTGNNETYQPRTLHRSRSTTIISSEDDRILKDPSMLIRLLEGAIDQCKRQSDHVNAHYWFKTLEKLRRVLSGPSALDAYSSLLGQFFTRSRESLEWSTNRIEICETWSVWMKQIQDIQDSETRMLANELDGLRNKMWYTVDVRNSGPYEEARNVAQALKVMGMSGERTAGNPTPPAASNPRDAKSFGKSLLMRSEAQYVKALAAPVQFGGPIKLADEQTSNTYQWLERYGIENFCKGEERIHRLCYEVDRCVNKIVGDGIMQGPVLWSSGLFAMEKEILDTVARDGYFGFPQLDKLSFAVGDQVRLQPADPEEENRILSESNTKWEASATTSAQISPTRRQNLPRLQSGSKAEPTGTRDIMSNTNTFLSIDSSETYYSPFPSQSKRRSTRTTNTIRPRSAATLSSSSSSHITAQRQLSISKEKRIFLDNIKQTLTGLLLSDLGSVVFPNGSETDMWFGGQIGQVCLDQRIANEERALKRKRRTASSISDTSLQTGQSRAKSRENSGHQTVVASPANKDLSNPGESVYTDNLVEPLQSLALTKLSPHESSTGTDVCSNSAAHSTYHYEDAFRSLLRKFAIHSNPFTKLELLTELYQLIVASLPSSADDSTHDRNQPTGSSKSGQGCGYTASEPVRRVDGVTRKTHYISSSSTFTTNHKTDGDHDMTNTTTAVGMLRSLFRDSSIRPKALFRDLQYIAASVPLAVLEESVHGKALWDAGLAALLLKQDVCQVMVELADEIVAWNTQKRSASLKATATGANTGRSSSMSRPNVSSGSSLVNGSAVNNVVAPASSLATSSSIIQDNAVVNGPLTTNSIPTPSNVTNTPNTNGLNTSTTPALHPNTVTDADRTASTAHPLPDNPSPEHTSHTEPPPSPPLSRYTMADAAAMLLIAAKEGDAVAERELATFYLSDPDLLPVTIAPLTRPCDVFKADLIASVTSSNPSNSTSIGGSGAGLGVISGDGSRGATRSDTFTSASRSGTRSRTGGGGGGSLTDSNAVGRGGSGADKSRRGDPITMCVAQHWMELSARGGDQLARTYLRDKDEMERIPSV